ncbi:excinuclease ATPase subunit [Endozoicomonas sp. SM1973]|uniref:Excinuclease ATPase subunit n=1 Tax=Spartinivicinus marinus TaxID=2994442 RepID=A0A853I5F5_9GAMM|nr:excinuclease ATPase subunit [Spartinivicinus marinus]MCX4025397.1 excinuclease ATPase subunit [Spartinivicinus marinus]NYZ65374.1 excinuclease ATPase subunit [Spartinivicinus marinus]
MKLKALCTLLAFSTLAISSVEARDTRTMYSIQEALSKPAAKEKLLPNVPLYFGNQPTPRVLKRLGEYMSNKKTNAFNKSDKEACQWVILSALISLQQRAIQEGGNAVVNIKSYYKKNEISSTTEFECGAGALIAGVTLKGTVVKLAR